MADAASPDIPIAVGFTENEIVVTLADGSVLRNPLSWHTWLRNATPEQRLRYELSAFSIDWPELDEGLDLDGMRYGIPSDDHLREIYEEAAHQVAALTSQDQAVLDDLRAKLLAEGVHAPLAQALRSLLTEVEALEDR